MVEVRAETSGDADAVGAVHERAFRRPQEARLVGALRARVRPYIGLVAVEDGTVVGHAAFTGATLHCYSAPFGILALGPVAIEPERQRRGIGTALIRAGLDECRARGHDLVVVLATGRFYGRLGFVPARPRGVIAEWDVPDDLFQVVELWPGAQRNRRGVVYYAREFGLVGAPSSGISAW